MHQKSIVAIFKKFEKLNPSPTTELHYKTNFELLIAVVLSAQATDVMVNKITNKLFKIIQTPEQMLQFGEQRLQEAIRSIGLFKNKATNIIKLCKILIEKFDSQIPADRKDLESLPGVGRKTANIMLNTAFDQPIIAVDRHIFRVANRIGLVATNTVLATELQLLKIIPQKYIQNAHHWLVLHGRYICTARKPKCNNCVIRDYCAFFSDL